MCIKKNPCSPQTVWGRKLLCTVSLAALLAWSGGSDRWSGNLRLDGVKLPEGFSIELFPDGVSGARSVALGTTGVVFIETRRKGKVYAVVDRNKDNKAE